ncbi:MAG: glycosyltransferase family 2 protein [Solirubrobacteraceae bacterium]
MFPLRFERATDAPVHDRPFSYGRRLTEAEEQIADGFAVETSVPPPATRTVQHERVLSGRDLVAYWALTALWLAVVGRFWLWWLQPQHHGSLGFFIPASLCLAYLSTALPCFYWYFVRRMRRPVHIPPSPTRRVAMITLCVPSHESRRVIAGQLVALTRVNHPHDSWLLDEGGDPELKGLAESLGVRYFSRKGIAHYNEPGPPFQAKTKAGNVNAWLDHIEGEGITYDVFVQLDIDHRPNPDYLDRTLGYFDDPEVAWVQAPSVCRNLDSWTARGLAEQEVVLQGPLQMGFYGRSRTPFIIGSHTSYRTSAIYDINGFQPTRAEDHLDTVVLAANGYRGVYVPEIIAEGDGPEDLSTYLRQQFAWAYSMVQIFIKHTPRLVGSYAPSQAFQFLMAQSWYLLWSLSLAVLWVLPIVALLTDTPIANVSLLEFVVYQWPLTLTALLLWWWTRRWFQPVGIDLTWRGVLLEVARWPVVLAAVITAMLGIQRNYMITRKGNEGVKLSSGLALYGPYLVLAAVAVAAIAASMALLDPVSTQPYVVLVLLNGVGFVALLVCALGLEIWDVGRRMDRVGGALRARAGSLCAVMLAVAGMSAAVAFAWSSIAASLQ